MNHNFFEQERYNLDYYNKNQSNYGQNESIQSQIILNRLYTFFIITSLLKAGQTQTKHLMRITHKRNKGRYFKRDFNRKTGN